MSTLLNREETAVIAGPAAALMLFGQNGACVGKTFRLFTARGREVVVTMTEGGARIDSKMSKAQIAELAAMRDDTIED